MSILQWLITLEIQIPPRLFFFFLKKEKIEKTGVHAVSCAASLVLVIFIAGVEASTSYVIATAVLAQKSLELQQSIASCSH